ncbi:DNA topoisomerase 1 [Mycoplasmopsis californica]|uniref:DNA topoisomerase 1 n=1 Tax=Mycoplasmopsis equigenitalium TaxID=114883 RepID=A0ABY5J3X7_9BACT|nr:type I DNA topoisomerase [Mycoplasmopsis equigenitalium]UUD36847.1 type I DNA topoisomerase [Mycoplasmopsis equigenitalium]VEU69857.1 DNA topoisomerase 1 [Mycoplasmopsis californica]
MENNKTLVIVESPNKIKAIEKYLKNHGVNCEVEATVGHIAILPTTGKDRLGIDLENWVPLYKIDPAKRKVVANLRAKAKQANTVVIATDHDREGEAIADNLVEYLKIEDKYVRIVFNEITEQAIIEAYKNPGKIDEQLVNAQKTRRMLDRILGFKLSTLMRRNIKNSTVNPSAGRVQSIALKLIVDRENEIKAFIPVVYFNIVANFKDGNSAKYFDPNSKQESKDWIMGNDLEKILNDLHGPLKVINTETKVKSDDRIVPLKQATLYKKMSYSSGVVQSSAQRLYEGYNDDGGLISYPRTDSTRYSATFIQSARNYITKKYGEDYLLDEIKGAKAGDQDAHEAIRPTNLNLTPQLAKEKYNLSTQDYNVYNFIYKTTMQSLMKPSKREITSYTYENNGHLFRNNSSKIVFDGYLVIEEEKETKSKEFQYKLNDFVEVKKYVDSKHETKPPARYTEGSLISMLDEIKVGRPSTFASTIKIVKDREYAIKEGSSLVPTEFGITVLEQLIKHFPKMINETYTAYVEEELDRIALENKPVQVVMDDFNDEFNDALENATKTIQPTFLIPKILDEKCPEDGGELIERKSRFGKKFIGCNNFPACKYTKSVGNGKFYKRKFKTIE